MAKNSADLDGRKPIGWKPVALDGGYGWVVVLGSFLIHVFADGFVYSFGVIAESLVKVKAKLPNMVFCRIAPKPVLKMSNRYLSIGTGFGAIRQNAIFGNPSKEFDVTNAEVSTILSILTGLMLAAGPVASAICNRIGCRITTIIGSIIASIGCAISYYATSMTYLLFSVGIVMGTGFGLMYCPAIVVVTMYFEKYRSLATGVTVCGAGVGTFLFSKIIGFLIVNFDWRSVFLIYAGLVLLCVPCGALYRPIEFIPIYDDEDEAFLQAEEQEIKNLEELNSEKFALQNGTALTHGLVGGPRKKTTSVSATHAEPIPEEDRFSEEPEFVDSPIREAQTTASNPTLNRLIKRSREEGDSAPNSPIGNHLQLNGTEMRSAVSQLLVESGTTNNNNNNNDEDSKKTGVLQRFRSLGEHLHFTGTPIQRHGTFRPSTKSTSVVPRIGHRSKTISTSIGYLNVKDVFFPGSITALPEYNQDQQRFRSVTSLQHPSDKLGGGSHHTSTLKMVGQETQGLIQQDGLNETYGGIDEATIAIVDGGGGDDAAKKRKCGGMDEEISSSTSATRAIEIWRTIKKMMDLSLLVDPIYLLFAISNFLTSIGFNAPPMFMPMNAETVLGFNKFDAATTVSAYGLANIFGRIAFGLVCDRQLPFGWGKDRARNRLWIYNGTLIFCGLASCLVFLMTGFYSFTGYCFFFGFTISSYVCLTSVVLVDLVGVNRLTNAFGLLLFIQGIATFVGPPIAGQLYDLTKRYDWTFGFCGVCLFLSGAMLFVIPTVRRRQQRSKLTTEATSTTSRKSQSKIENGDGQQPLLLVETPN